MPQGVLSCDRYAAYIKMARKKPGIVLSFCWAHQRRDFLKLANDHPALLPWALRWVDRIGKLYHLHQRRSQAKPGGAYYAARTQHLRNAALRMEADCDKALADVTLAAPAVKVLQTLKKYWPGLMVCIEQAGVPMDNNAAERALRTAVVGRKNFYGSGSQWSGQLTAMMLSVLMTARLWKLNARTWLSSYLHACAANGNQPPPDLTPFLPWAMDARRLAEMRRPWQGSSGMPPQEIDTS